MLERTVYHHPYALSLWPHDNKLGIINFKLVYLCRSFENQPNFNIVSKCTYCLYLQIIKTMCHAKFEEWNLEYNFRPKYFLSL